MCLVVLPYDALKQELGKIDLELNDELWLTIVNSIEHHVIVGDISISFNLEFSETEFHSFECGYFDDGRVWGFNHEGTKVSLAKFVNCKMQ